MCWDRFKRTNQCFDVCLRGAEKELTSCPRRMDFYMLCHAQAAKPVFPYSPFKLQCVWMHGDSHKGNLSPRGTNKPGFSNSNYNRQAETSSGKSV